jgi:hypothetical protein
LALAAIGNLNAQLNAGVGTITAGIDAIAPAVTVLAKAPHTQIGGSTIIRPCVDTPMG